MSSQFLDQFSPVDIINSDILSFTQQTLYSSNICSNIQSVTSIINSFMQGSLPNEVKKSLKHLVNIQLITSGLPSRFYSSIINDKSFLKKLPKLTIMHFIDQIMRIVKIQFQQIFSINAEQTQQYMLEFLKGFIAEQANPNNKSMKKSAKIRVLPQGLNKFFQQNILKLILSQTFKLIKQIRIMMYKIGSQIGRLTDIISKSQSIMGQVNFEYRPLIQKIELLIKNEKQRKTIWLELIKNNAFINYLSNQKVSNDLQKNIVQMDKKLYQSNQKLDRIGNKLRCLSLNKKSEPSKQKLSRVYSISKSINLLKRKSQQKSKFQINIKRSLSKKNLSSNNQSLPMINNRNPASLVTQLKSKKPQLKLDRNKEKNELKLKEKEQHISEIHQKINEQLEE